VKSSTSATQANKKSNDNVVRNNVIDKAGRDGINVTSGDRNRIEGNRVTNSGNAAASDGIRITSADSIRCDDNIVQGNVATDTQTTKTQRYGLNIASSLCARTFVGSNDFSGNRVKGINDVGTGTQYAADTVPPSVPTNVAATAVSHAQINLSWNASTDNVGVAQYTIRRGGQVLTSVSGSTTTYSDTSVQPSTTYSYTVEALDAANNPSGQSSPAGATTPATPSSFTLTPVADSYVNESSPSTNYGSATTLKADASPVNRSYLRFSVQGVSSGISRATLRVLASSASSIGHEVRGVSDNTWGESTINFSNAPAVGGVIRSSGAFSAGTWVEVDVTSYVTGNGTYSLALTTPSSTSISYASRQSSNAPQLAIVTGTAPPDTQAPTTPGNVTATAVNQARIDLSWTASSDNVGIHHYTIRRGGQVLTTVAGSSTSYSDTSVQPATSYSYTVQAFDAAGNFSAESAPPATATTPAAPPGGAIAPTADAYVQEASPTTNYGSATSLRVDGSPLVRSYLRFTVQGLVGPVSQATLRVFANSASSTGHEVRGVASNTWGETTINFSNAPAFGSVIGSSGAITANTWTTVDVTSYITGNGTYSLALTGPGSTAISYASRESANAPQLVVNGT
jgi:parallel beta-helix repeat protein